MARLQQQLIAAFPLTSCPLCSSVSPLWRPHELLLLSLLTSAVSFHVGAPHQPASRIAYSPLKSGSEEVNARVLTVRDLEPAVSLSESQCRAPGPRAASVVCGEK